MPPPALARLARWYAVLVVTAIVAALASAPH
jgi:hypothetical protein